MLDNVDDKNENDIPDNVDDDKNDNDDDEFPKENVTIEEVDDKSVKENGTNEDVDGLIHNKSIPFNIYDPSTWNNLDIKYRDLPVINSPTRDPTLEKGAKDNLSRCFSSSHYTCYLSNGEKCDRPRQVYSNDLDRVFCFCCKLFKRDLQKSRLIHEGFSDWVHLSVRLKEHEMSSVHINNMATWIDLRARLNKNETIDVEIQIGRKYYKE
ncbi:zinc finger MYM-type protein 5-like [Olea europaea var. sylvestris]|uniref:zinc finger MYM-type protein 5-like n=1 Tax=Olea europaea var. sylvestris TaxID=158386 RepID=UPI000C1D04C4|nr:zinc finger MYM-type protein 5-like [Olea europaea var. sylvestris]